MKLTKLLARFRRDEKGVTLVEYGIGITLALVLGTGALATLAGNIGTSMASAGSVMCTGEGADVTCPGAE
ncbi:hypothetical protein V8J36_11715 [Frigidibacter sp. MR17.14]|uniref:Flp family type IVb pilin n=1 Tax=Frigidibacter sp. MR17.14 TaxID=3126509 RepID=UPI003012FE15